MTCEAQRGISHADVLHLFLAMLKAFVLSLSFCEIMAASFACAAGLIEIQYALTLVMISVSCIALMAGVTWKKEAMK